MKTWVIVFLLAFEFLAFSQASKPVVTLATMEDLERRFPVAGEIVEVRNGSLVNLWSAPRMFVHATNSETPDRVWVTTNKMVGTRYMALDRNSTIVDVCICGAIGDGVTNDTAALQFAASWVTAGKVLYSPAGKVFRITDTVSVTNSRTKIQFSGSKLLSEIASRLPAIRIGPASQSITGMDFSISTSTNAVLGVPAGTFAAGDMVMLYNLIESPSDYYPGQLAFVESASGTSIVLDRFPDTALQVTNALRFVAAPEACEIRNVVVDLSGAGDGIGIEVIGRGHLVENCRVVGTGATNDPNYIGIELRGQAIVARGNYTQGILDAGNTVDRAGYGIFASGDNIVVENNELLDSKHCLSTSERRAFSPSIHILNNRMRQREDWAAVLSSPGLYLFLGTLDVHANVRTAEIRGNDLLSSRLALSLRNGDFDIINNRVEVREQAGLPYVQHGNGFGEAFITRAVISGNTFIAPTNASQFYWDHSDYGVAGVHRRMIWQGNTFRGAGLTINDQEGSLVNPFEDLSFIGNVFERTNGTPLAFVGTVSNVVISGNLFRYGGTGNGITFAIPTNPPIGREIFISGNSFVREPGGTGFDIDATVATNMVSLAANRWSPSSFSYVGPVHGISGSILVTMHDQRDTYPRVVGTYDGKLKFGTGESQPFSSISLLYPGAIQTDAIWTVKTSDLTQPVFGAYLNSFSNFWNFGFRGDGLFFYRYSNEVSSAVMTPIVAGPRRHEDLTNGVWRLTGNLGITSNAVPIIPEGDTVTLNLANSTTKVLKLYWPDGTSGSLWHAYNDGAGSGLDADYLDGQHGDYYLARSNHVGTQSVSTITGLGPLATGDAPTNGVPHGRQDGAWVEIPATNHVHSDYYPRSGGTNNPITGPVVLGYSTPALVLRDTSGTNVVTFTYGGPWGELVFGRADPSSLTSIGVTYAVFSDTQAIFSTDLSAPTVTGNTVSSLGYLNAGDDLRLSAADADSPGVVMLNNSGTLGVRQWFDGAHWNLYTASATPPYAEIEKLVRVETNGIVTVQKPIRTRTGTLGYMTPVAGHAPGAAAATVSTRNSKPIVAYDPTTEEHYRWTWVIPNGFNTPALDGADNLNFLLHWTSSATSGSVRWVVKLQRLTGVDIDSDSFASGSVVTTAVSGTAGTVVVSTTGNVGLDSAVAGDAVEIDVYRDTGDAGDTVDSNDAELLAIEIRNW